LVRASHPARVKGSPSPANPSRVTGTVSPDRPWVAEDNRAVPARDRQQRRPPKWPDFLGIRAELGERDHGVKALERSGRLYRLLRVPVAKRFMPNGDYAVRLSRRFRPGFRLISDRESAARWELTTRSKEAGHLTHLGMTLPLAGYLLANYAFANATTLAALDIVFDLYPIMVQRYNRMRIRELLARRHGPSAA
jgi:hypothetical protein